MALADAKKFNKRVPMPTDKVGSLISADPLRHCGSWVLGFLSGEPACCVVE
jgi:hypothetical protein